MKKSSLIKLALVGTALVLIPRRSSKKAECATSCGCSAKKANDEQATNQATNKEKSCSTEGKGCDCKNCKCPLCRIGKCPLCAIGKCFCCKKSADKAEKKGGCGRDKKTEK